MKKYIKPEIDALEMETLPAIAAGSPLSGDGKKGNLEETEYGDASLGRVKRKAFGSIWEEPLDDEEDEEDEDF